MKAGVAQLVEQRIRNARVGGSNPPIGCIFALLLLFSSLAYSAQGFEYGITDETFSANSDGAVSPGEKILLLFSFHRTDMLYDSVSPFSVPNGLIQNTRFDRPRQRGNFELIVASDLKADTSLRIKMIAFGSRRQETLFIDVPVLFQTDSIRIAVDRKAASVKLFHSPFPEQRFARNIRIKRFPDLWDTTVGATYFDTNSLQASFNGLNPGLYSAEVLIEGPSFSYSLKSPIAFFFISNGHNYKYILLTDIGNQQSGLNNSLELSTLINESAELCSPDGKTGNSLILPFSFVSEEIWKTICEPALIIFIKAGENAMISEDIASKIHSFAGTKPVIILGATTLKSIFSAGFSSFRDFPFYLSGLKEHSSVSGNLEGEMNLNGYFSADMVLTCEASDTLLRISNIPIVVNSGNYYIVFPQYHACPELYPQIADQIVRSPVSEIIPDNVFSDSIPVEIKSIHPNPVGSSGALIVVETQVSGIIKLFIADITGREVISVFEGEVEKGRHEYFWNGRDRFGSQLPKSLYFATGVFTSGGEYFQTAYKITLF